MCGLCCKSHIAFTKRPGDEMRKLMEWRGIRVIDIPPERLPARYRRDIAWSKVIIPTNPCKHLNEDGTCAIHENKPKICKEYPTQQDSFMLLPECGYNTKKIKGG